MAIQPGSANPQGSRSLSDTAELPAVAGRRKRRPGRAALFALLGLGGLGLAGIGIMAQLKPRVFTPVQQHQIEAWDIAKRWRTIPKTRIFPPVIRYRVSVQPIGSTEPLNLTASRLKIARQATCASVAGAKSLLPLLAADHCQALLRATYADASSSFVVTVGVAVLRDQASATRAAQVLVHRASASGSAGGVARQVLLRPLLVPNSPAAWFGVRQRQLSWVVDARSYLVVATVGYADGRPRVQVNTDSYVLVEMTSLARGIADVIAAPLAAQPPAPHCPAAGAPPC